MARAGALHLERSAFDESLERLSPIDLSETALDQLWVHFCELGRWNQRLSLIGPGTVEEVLSRHYGESLAAVRLLEPTDRRLVDVGSGAGFPGIVLAAARPDLDVTLVDSRQKKWSFLSVVCDKAALPCRCVNARVGASFPRDFPLQIDVIASRAVKFSEAEIEMLGRRLVDGGRFLLWTGAEAQSALSGLCPGREITLAGSRTRRILELFPPSEARH